MPVDDQTQRQTSPSHCSSLQARSMKKSNWILRELARQMVELASRHVCSCSCAWHTYVYPRLVASNFFWFFPAFIRDQAEVNTIMVRHCSLCVWFTAIKVANTTPTLGLNRALDLQSFPSKTKLQVEISKDPPRYNLWEFKAVKTKTKCQSFEFYF